MEAKLIKSDVQYRLHNEEGIVIATSTDGKLSIKNCQTIERDYDLDEEISKIVKTIVPDDRGTDIWYGTSMAVGKQCFQKALEVNSDKRFTFKEMVDCWNKALNFQEHKETLGDYMQSLQQTEWNVEIVMGDPIGIGDKYTPDTKPKLDEDGFLILKRK